jgi:hypothetical protein
MPSGTLAMGSAHHKGHRDEEPMHCEVGSFFLSQFIITQEQCKAVIRKLPPCREAKVRECLPRNE